MSTPRPLRIACLHGFRQNARRFRQKTGALRKHLERNVSQLRSSTHASATYPLAELVYIDAPFVLEKIPGPENPSDDKPDPVCERATFSPPTPMENPEPNAKKVADLTQRSWWAAEGRVYHGWEQSFEYLRPIFAAQKFDGILGFSQGAIAASLLCALQQTNSVCAQDFSSVRFVVLISGFPSRADVHAYLYESPIKLRSLHAWGAQDKIVSAWMSKALLHRFHPDTRMKLEHPGGHVVPNDAESRKQIVEFLMDFADQAEKIMPDPPRAAL